MKKFMAGSIAVILAIGFSAFTFQNQHVQTPKTGEKWFHFNGVDPTDLNTASKYSLDGDGSAPLICPFDVSAPYRCEVLAVPTGSPARPNLSTIIAQRKRTTP